MANRQEALAQRALKVLNILGDKIDSIHIPMRVYRMDRTVVDNHDLMKMLATCSNFNGLQYSLYIDNAEHVLCAIERAIERGVIPPSVKK